jgi:hypothetical protein
VIVSEALFCHGVVLNRTSSDLSSACRFNESPENNDAIVAEIYILVKLVDKSSKLTFDTLFNCKRLDTARVSG